MYCDMFAHLLAHEQRSTIVDVSELLAGIYLAHAEKISAFWDSSDQFEELLLNDCRIDEPRWFYWIRLYEALYHRKRDTFLGRHMRYSAQLLKTLNLAQELAASRMKGDSTAVLIPEDVLLAIAKQPELDIGAKLVRSGLDLQRLELTVKKWGESRGG